MMSMGLTGMLRNNLLPILLLLVFAWPLHAQERITSFDSWIEVEPSGLVRIVETIAVVADGDKIRRGIYRDFPTDYVTPAGNRVKVGFSLMDIQRNGRPEPYHTERLKNGMRIYIGDKDVFLEPGLHTYTIVYQTSRQIGFFDGYDELYWNVTGNGWDFPIETASATVVLPEGSSILQSSSYTGPQGATGSNAKVTGPEGNEIRFRTTAPLRRGEGLTIAVAWPKGIVPEPGHLKRTAFFLKDNLTVLVAAAGFLILVGYYITVWARVGRDPESGAIIPRFEPPKGFSPAAARFVMRMGFDDKAFTAAVVSLAVKKYLVIEQQDKNDFVLTRTTMTDQGTLSRGEKKVTAALFAYRDSLALKQINHQKIGAAVNALEKSLQDEFEALHFKRNGIYLVPGVLITLGIVLSLIFGAQDKEVAGFMALWLSIWTGACYILVYRAVNLWKTAASGFLAKGGALSATFFALPFTAGWFLGVFVLSTAISWTGMTALLSILALNILFYHLLRAPTVQGRRIMDQLEGLKLYLSVAEKDRLNLLNPPEKTPELFERFLPWALALDVEQQWSEQFSTVLEQAKRDGSYTPTFYHGRHHFSSSALASSLGSSLSASIASSSTAPGSSSGSGGGGSSGGGGGGGGGGGW